jgi:hypothetical protein
MIVGLQQQFDRILRKILRLQVRKTLEGILENSDQRLEGYTFHQTIPCI